MSSPAYGSGPLHPGHGHGVRGYGLASLVPSPLVGSHPPGVQMLPMSVPMSMPLSMPVSLPMHMTMPLSVGPMAMPMPMSMPVMSMHPLAPPSSVPRLPLRPQMLQSVKSAHSASRLPHAATHFPPSPRTSTSSSVYPHSHSHSQSHSYPQYPVSSSSSSSASSLSALADGMEIDSKDSLKAFGDMREHAAIHSQLRTPEEPLQGAIAASSSVSQRTPTQNQMHLQRAASQPSSSAAASASFTVSASSSSPFSSSSSSSSLSSASASSPQLHGSPASAVPSLKGNANDSGPIYLESDIDDGNANSTMTSNSNSNSSSSLNSRRMMPVAFQGSSAYPHMSRPPVVTSVSAAPPVPFSFRSSNIHGVGPLPRYVVYQPRRPPLPLVHSFPAPPPPMIPNYAGKNRSRMIDEDDSGDERKFPGSFAVEGMMQLSARGRNPAITDEMMLEHASAASAQDALALEHQRAQEHSSAPSPLLSSALSSPSSASSSSSSASSYTHLLALQNDVDLPQALLRDSVDLLSAVTVSVAKCIRKYGGRPELNLNSRCVCHSLPVASEFNFGFLTSNTRSPCCALHCIEISESYIYEKCKTHGKIANASQFFAALFALQFGTFHYQKDKRGKQTRKRISGIVFRSRPRPSPIVHTHEHRLERMLRFSHVYSKELVESARELAKREIRKREEQSQHRSKGPAGTDTARSSSAAGSDTAEAVGMHGYIHTHSQNDSHSSELDIDGASRDKRVKGKDKSKLKDKDRHDKQKKKMKDKDKDKRRDREREKRSKSKRHRHRSRSSSPFSSSASGSATNSDIDQEKRHDSHRSKERTKEKDKDDDSSNRRKKHDITGDGESSPRVAVRRRGRPPSRVVSGAEERKKIDKEKSALERALRRRRRRGGSAVDADGDANGNGAAETEQSELDENHALEEEKTFEAELKAVKGASSSYFEQQRPFSHFHDLSVLYNDELNSEDDADDEDYEPDWNGEDNEDGEHEDENDDDTQDDMSEDEEEIRHKRHKAAEDDEEDEDKDDEHDNADGGLGETRKRRGGRRRKILLRSRVSESKDKLADGTAPAVSVDSALTSSSDEEEAESKVTSSDADPSSASGQSGKDKTGNILTYPAAPFALIGPHVALFNTPAERLARGLSALLSRMKDLVKPCVEDYANKSCSCAHSFFSPQRREDSSSVALHCCMAHCGHFFQRMILREAKLRAGCRNDELAALLFALENYRSQSNSDSPFWMFRTRPIAKASYSVHVRMQQIQEKVSLDECRKIIQRAIQRGHEMVDEGVEMEGQMDQAKLDDDESEKQTNSAANDRKLRRTADRELAQDAQNTNNEEQPNHNKRKTRARSLMDQADADDAPQDNESPRPKAHAQADAAAAWRAKRPRRHAANKSQDDEAEGHTHSDEGGDTADEADDEGDVDGDVDMGTIESLESCALRSEDDSLTRSTPLPVKSFQYFSLNEIIRPIYFAVRYIKQCARASHGRGQAQSKLYDVHVHHSSAVRPCRVCNDPACWSFDQWQMSATMKVHPYLLSAIFWVFHSQITPQLFVRTVNKEDAGQITIHTSAHKLQQVDAVILQPQNQLLLQQAFQRGRKIILTAVDGSSAAEIQNMQDVIHKDYLNETLRKSKLAYLPAAEKRKGGVVVNPSDAKLVEEIVFDEINSTHIPKPAQALLTKDQQDFIPTRIMRSSPQHQVRMLADILFHMRMHLDYHAMNCHCLYRPCSDCPKESDWQHQCHTFSQSVLAAALSIHTGILSPIFWTCENQFQSPLLYRRLPQNLFDGQVKSMRLLHVTPYRFIMLEHLLYTDNIFKAFSAAKAKAKAKQGADTKSAKERAITFLPKDISFTFQRTQKARAQADSSKKLQQNNSHETQDRENEEAQQDSSKHPHRRKAANPKEKVSASGKTPSPAPTSSSAATKTEFGDEFPILPIIYEEDCAELFKGHMDHTDEQDIHTTQQSARDAADCHVWPAVRDCASVPSFRIHPQFQLTFRDLDLSEYEAQDSDSHGGGEEYQQQSDEQEAEQDEEESKEESDEQDNESDRVMHVVAADSEQEMLSATAANDLEEEENDGSMQEEDQDEDMGVE